MKIGTIDPLAEQTDSLEVQMKCDSGSELWLCELDVLSSSSSNSCRDGGRALDKTSDSTVHDQAMDLDCQPDRSSSPRSILAERRSTLHVVDGSAKRAPSCCNPGGLHKRKLDLLGAEVAALEKRKKQCTVGMEAEQEGGSASEPCWCHLTTD